MKESTFDDLVQILFNSNYGKLELRISSLFGLNLKANELKESVLFITCHQNTSQVLGLLQYNLLKIEPDKNSDLISTYINLIQLLTKENLSIFLENPLVYQKLNEALTWEDVSQNLSQYTSLENLDKYKLIITQANSNKALYFNEYKKAGYSGDALLVRAIDDGYQFTQQDWDEQALVCDMQEVNFNSGFEKKIVRMPFNLDLENYSETKIFFKIFNTNPTIMLPENFASYFMVLTNNFFSYQNGYNKSDYKNDFLSFIQNNAHHKIKIPKYVIMQTLRNMSKNKIINQEEKIDFYYNFYKMCENKDYFDECLEKNFASLKSFIEHKILNEKSEEFIAKTTTKKKLKI
jgi:hypothetical protein